MKFMQSVKSAYHDAKFLALW